jgi:hypothetical protein
MNEQEAEELKAELNSHFEHYEDFCSIEAVIRDGTLYLVFWNLGSEIALGKISHSGLSQTAGGI